MENIEWLDLVNEQDVVTGTLSRDDIYTQGRRNFRVINAFLVNSRGELWIPRRTAHKRLFPNALDMSVGGHVESGEDYLTCFRRETREELGLDLNTVPWREIAYFTPHTTTLSAFMRVYEIQSGDTPNFNRADFSEAFWLTPRKLLERIQSGDPAKGDLAELVQRCYLS